MTKHKKVIDRGDKERVEIPGYEGIYEINELGQVRSYRKNGNKNNTIDSEPQKLLQPRRKYLKTYGPKATVTLFDGLKHKHHYVSRLVAQVFLGLDIHDKTKQVININGNNMDCRKENLYIGSVSDRTFNFHNPGILFSNKGLNEKRTNDGNGFKTSYFLLHK